MAKKEIINFILKIKEQKQLIKSFLQGNITAEDLKNNNIKLYGKIPPRK